jgi:hypothetical protein
VFTFNIINFFNKLIVLLLLLLRSLYYYYLYTNLVLVNAPEVVKKTLRSDFLLYLKLTDFHQESYRCIIHNRLLILHYITFAIKTASLNTRRTNKLNSVL